MSLKTHLEVDRSPGQVCILSACINLYLSLVRTETLTSIAYAILVPNVMFVLSLVVLVYWYCPYCQAKCKKYEQQTDVRDNHYE